MFTRSLAFLILFLACGFQIGAQSRVSCEQKRFGFYNSDLFYDDDDGVKELIERRNLAYAANFGHLDREARLLALEERENLLVEPVFQELQNEIKKLANENDLLLIDLSDHVLHGEIITGNKELDVTEQLIKFLNRRDKEKTPQILLKQNERKIVAIDSHFLHSKGGLKGFQLTNGETADNFCERTGKCTEVGKRIQEYAIEKGYGLVVDSSKTLSLELSNLICKDITKEFIEYYNDKVK